VQLEMRLEFSDGPPWLDCLVFSREENTIKIEVVRKSGTLLGEATISDIEFNQLADILLTRKN